jgi:DNA adenine methylase
MVLAIASNPIKWHGGKYYLAPKIVDLMPPHIH